MLVIGAGPSGLFAAIELARHGVRPRVFERSPTAHREARATALQPGTLEVLAQAQVLEPILEASVHLLFARVFDSDLMLVSELAYARAGGRWGFQSSLPQWRTEEILEGRLRELGVEVERGVTVTAVRESDEAVRVSLQRSSGEAGETVQARYVIGAGGAHSITRRATVGDLHGATYPGTAAGAEVALDCELPRDGSALIASRGGYVALGPLPDERWILFVGVLGDDELERLSRDRSMSSFAQAVERRIVDRIRLRDVGWTSVFRMHNRIASRLEGERWFLLGDAGHVSSPFGGEGLNSGLEDGHNLGWKLALVVRGCGRPCLVESFGIERMAADRHVLEVSDRLHALAFATVEAARAGVSPAPMSTGEVDALVRSRAMLDGSYTGSPLVGEYVANGKAPGRELVPGERFAGGTAPSGSHRLLVSGAVDEASLARIRDRWRGLVDVVRGDGALPEGCGALLIRPDGYIGFRAGAADAAALAALDRHLDSYLISGS